MKADNARIDRLKEQLRSTPQEVDFERVRIMAEVYIDDNLFVGSMASTVNGIYTYPEWNVD